MLVIYWKKTGLLHTKISNHNIIYSSQKPRKLSSLPLKSSSWFFFHYLTIKMLYNRCMCIYKFGNNTYPRLIRRRSTFGQIFLGKKCVLWAGKYGILWVYGIIVHNKMFLSCTPMEASSAVKKPHVKGCGHACFLVCTVYLEKSAA